MPDGLNDLPQVKEPSPAEPPAPAPAAAPVKEENNLNDESTTGNSLDDWAIDGLNALLTDNSDSLGPRPSHSVANSYQFIDKGQTVHNDAKTKSKNSSFLTIQDYDKTFDDTFNLEDALDTPETTAKAPKGNLYIYNN